MNVSRDLLGLSPLHDVSFHSRARRGYEIGPAVTTECTHTRVTERVRGPGDPEAELTAPTPDDIRAAITRGGLRGTAELLFALGKMHLAGFAARARVVRTWARPMTRAAAMTGLSPLKAARRGNGDGARRWSCVGASSARNSRAAPRAARVRAWLRPPRKSCRLLIAA